MSKQNQEMSEPERLRIEYHIAVSQGNTRKAIEIGDKLYDYHFQIYERGLANLREIDAELGKNYPHKVLDSIRAYRDKLRDLLEGYAEDLNDSLVFLIDSKSKQIFHNL